MAHPYCDRTSVKVSFGAIPLEELLDLDQDGTEDEGLFAQVAEDSDRYIDSKLGTTFVVPFDPVVVPLVETMSRKLTLAQIIERRNPDAPDARVLRDEVERLLAQILAEEIALVGATKLDAEDRRVGLLVDAADPIMAGRDENGVSRMRDW